MAGVNSHTRHLSGAKGSRRLNGEQISIVFESAPVHFLSPIPIHSRSDQGASSRQPPIPLMICPRQRPAPAAQAPAGRTCSHAPAREMWGGGALSAVTAVAHATPGHRVLRRGGVSGGVPAVLTAMDHRRLQSDPPLPDGRPVMPSTALVTGPHRRAIPHVPRGADVPDQPRAEHTTTPTRTATPARRSPAALQRTHPQRKGGAVSYGRGGGDFRGGNVAVKKSGTVSPRRSVCGV